MPRTNRSSASRYLAITLVVSTLIFLRIQFRIGLLLDGSKQLSILTTPPARRPKLADGCHHVFLDVGANIGIHARFLFEPELYPDATHARSWFDQAYGTNRDNRDVCVFAFEPNPKHKERLTSMADAYASMGWRYIPIMAGVSDNEGTLEFVPSRDDLGRGFTARGSGQGNDQNKHMVSVPVKRLASWLLEEVDGRLPPTKVYGQYESNVPAVVMKLDIETLEYIVLPDLLLSGALCQVITAVYGEVHYQFFPLNFEENKLHLKKASEGKRYFMDQLRLMEITRHCPTTWTIDDDESYSYDGMPLPGQSKNQVRGGKKFQQSAAAKKKKGHKHVSATKTK